MPQTMTRSEIADQLRTLADDLKTAWTEITAVAEKPLTEKDLRKRCRIAWSFAVEAGELLFQLQDAGAFDSDPDVDGLVRQARTHRIQQAACNEAFLCVIEHRWASWRPMRKFGAACGRLGVGPVYADAMRRLAKDIAAVDGAASSSSSELATGTVDKLTTAQNVIMVALRKSNVRLTREALSKSRLVGQAVSDPKTIRKHVKYLLERRLIVEPSFGMGLDLTDKGLGYLQAADGAPR